MFTTTIKTLLYQVDDDDKDLVYIAKRFGTFHGFTKYIIISLVNDAIRNAQNKTNINMKNYSSKGIRRWINQPHFFSIL